MKYVELYKRYMYKVVEGIINVWDPISLISVGAPYDEYAPEVDAFIEGFDFSMNAKEIKDLLNSVFEHFFNNDDNQIYHVDPLELEEASERIYEEIEFFKEYFPIEMTSAYS